MSSPALPSDTPDIHNAALRLKCPECGGGLNLKRKHLGMTGRCVHCQATLTAKEENGEVFVVVGGASAPQPAKQPIPTTETPAPEPLANIQELAQTTALNEDITTDFASSLSGRSSGELLSDRIEITAPNSRTVDPPKPASSLFGESKGDEMPFSSLFKTEDTKVDLTSTWGAKPPKESHASLSPYETDSSGEAFAETLFREKVARETPAPHKQDCTPKIILDGDGRPMAPMTKAEEEEFAMNFFKIDRARKEPRWRKRLVRFLIMNIVLGLAGIVAFFVTPKDKLAEVQADAAEWLGPGLAVLDYLPESVRPEWLPRTDYGIDAGLDENGNPKPKMNAFEGLKKLEVDIGNMRGDAEKELEKLKDF